MRSALSGANVPIEAGSDYLSADLIDVPGDLYVAALQQLAAAGDDDGAAPRATAYMAQVSVHALPEAARRLFAEHVPTLAPAASPPPYRTNVWLGPTGTVTPAHRDPYPNIVVQLLGAKVVRLYTPGDAGMYPFERGASLQTNTSRVDVEAAEIDPQFAAFAARRRDDERVVTLAPGDALHIPRHWWHHVRATSVSATVNFWWPAPRQLPDFEPGGVGHPRRRLGEIAAASHALRHPAAWIAAMMASAFSRTEAAPSSRVLKRHRSERPVGVGGGFLLRGRAA